MIQKVVRMRLFLISLIASAGLIQGVSTASKAGSIPDAMNGNLIREPALLDYQKGDRTPGFSKITEVLDPNGTPVRN